MDQLPHDPLEGIAIDDQAPHRSGQRDSLLLQADLRLAGEAAAQVRIRNLSAGGLMAELDRALPMGTPIEINVRNIGWIAGRIAWAAEGRVGIAFDKMIDPMRARKPVGVVKAVANRARPL